jgi:hypothetical protein
MVRLPNSCSIVVPRRQLGIAATLEDSLPV